MAEQNIDCALYIKINTDFYLIYVLKIKLSYCIISVK